MYCKAEFNFVSKTLEKLRIKQLNLTLKDRAEIVFNNGMCKITGISSGFDLPLEKYLNNPQEKTVYRLTDSFKLNYVYFLLPKKEQPLIVLGPFLSENLSQRQVFELCEKLCIPPSKHLEIEEFYSSMPIILPTSGLLIMLDTFFEGAFQTQNFSVIDVNREYDFPASPITETGKTDSNGDMLQLMKNMQKRYDYENQLIEVVSHGHIHEEARLLSFFSEQIFEARTPDPLRNIKNYAIIMNTLLRKGAEKGGVHPVYINSVSSDFAKKIERISVRSSCLALMREMFLSYCRLVRKHSTKNYSPIVQKALIIIQSDLTQELSPKSIAKTLKISLGYLCSIFKNQTGKTVCEYVREMRVNHAIHLLNTTQLQIQTVSYHCGIMDVQYFSKIFKKQTGKTPKEYRETLRRLNSER